MKLINNLQNYLSFFGLIIFILLVLIFIKVFDISYPITIVNKNISSELSVVGEGKVDVSPDTAYVDLGITVSNVSTVEEVNKKITDVNNLLLKSLQELGIKKEDITTSNFSIYPNYNYDGGTQRAQGYSGNASVNVKVRKLDIANQVIAKSTESGANQINGLRFSVDDPDKYREIARNKAIENARTQAEKLAKQLGIKLGKITNISESTPDRSYPMYYSTMPKAGGGASELDVSAGTQTITSQVTLFFEKR